VVDYPGEKKVLVAWTARSLNLVPVYEHATSKWIYYFRFDHQTLPGPDYLLRDLTLGRREHPYLQLSDVVLDSFGITTRGSGMMGLQTGFLNVSLEFLIENVGLSWAEDLMIGWIGYTEPSDGHVTQYLRSSIAVSDPDLSNYSGGMTLTHQSVKVAPRMAPFTLQGVVHNFSLPTRTHVGFYTPYVWDSAVYLLSRGSPPIWYRLRMSVDSDVLIHANKQLPTPEDYTFCEIERLPAGRPVVAWRSINSQPSV
jgi:hypothetical protein